MKEIPLTRGHVALVDDEDYERVSQHKWYAMTGKSGTTWAYSYIECSWAATSLHSFILGKRPEWAWVADHKNGVGTDNRRENLRWATAAQNAQNTRRAITGKTGFLGVRCFKNGKFAGCLTADGTVHLSKPCDTPEEAARARDELAKKHHGEFAVLNFSDEVAA